MVSRICKGGKRVNKLDSLFQKYLCPQKVSHTMAKTLEKKYVSMHIIYKINSQCNKNARRLENQKALYI